LRSNLLTRGSGKNPFLGRWRIIESEMWDRDALDLVVPAHITFGKGGLGEIELIAIGASIDFRVEDRYGTPRVEFSWSGYDDSDQACGRGWACLAGEMLTGQLFIHQGDDSTFVARKEAGRRARAD